VDQPVLNVFRMAGMMRGNSIQAVSDKAEGVDAILQGGVPTPEIDAAATRSGHDVSVMVWNYQDPDRTGASASVKLDISGLPKNSKRVLLLHYRIDADHSNSYTVWKNMGSPQQPSPGQFAQLETAGQLQLLESPRYINNDAGSSSVSFALPVQGISLLQLSW
jgi:xylan 1,4-beta-xylosidase